MKYIYSIFILFFLPNTCQTTQLTVKRTCVKYWCGSTFNTLEDSFQNPREEMFCNERNAKCTSNDCNYCKCNKTQDVFVSYKHGCKAYKDAKTMLDSKISC